MWVKHAEDSTQTQALHKGDNKRLQDKNTIMDYVVFTSISKKLSHLSGVNYKTLWRTSFWRNIKFCAQQTTMRHNQCCNDQTKSLKKTLRFPASTKNNHQHSLVRLVGIHSHNRERILNKWNVSRCERFDHVRYLTCSSLRFRRARLIITLHPLKTIVQRSG